MLQLSDRYVAQVLIPAALHTTDMRRMEVPNPHDLRIERGYWGLNQEPDDLGTPVPSGLLATIELVSDSLEDAEERTLAFGRHIETIVAHYGGAPRQQPQLKRLALVDATGALLIQWEYYYDLHWIPTVRYQPVDLQRFIERMLARDKLHGGRILLAARWYSIAVASPSDIDAYLACWIGLESVGPILHHHYHGGQRRAPCDVCGYPAGTQRDPKIAGPEHLIRRMAPELIQAVGFERLTGLRHDIAHALTDLPSLLVRVHTITNDLILCLASAILTAMATSGDDAETWVAEAPRDYEARPDARMSFEFPGPLPEHKPYFGGWLSVGRSILEERSLVGPEGEHIRGAAHAASAHVRMSEADVEAVRRAYVVFHRDGLELTYHEQPGREQPEVRPWRERPTSPVLERARARQAQQANTSADR